MEGNMKHYINVWLIIMLVSYVCLFVVTIRDENKKKRRQILTAIGIVSLILWNTSFRYFNLHASVVYLMAIFWIWVYTAPVDFGMRVFYVFSALAMIPATLGLIAFFLIPYDSWYTQNYIEEVLKSSPEKMEYIIPEQTDRVRFINGLDDYQIVIQSIEKNEDYEVEVYNVQFFSEISNEQIGPGSYYILMIDNARRVKVLPKKDGEADHVIRYSYNAYCKDINTDSNVRNIFYKEYEFYVPKEVAEKYNAE